MNSLVTKNQTIIQQEVEGRKEGRARFRTCGLTGGLKE
jgi:hypothetical protein